MRIGVPKEIKNNEFRVGLTPGAVREYRRHGHPVYVETELGSGIGVSDADYQAAGAVVLKTASEVFAQADMIVKVKEPQPSEYQQLRPDHILYTYLHLAPDPAQTQGLLASGCTAVAYETVTDPKGGLPLLAPMSEVAGRLSIQAAATALHKSSGGSGVLLGGVPGVMPGKVLIIGGGVVGTQAAKMAVGLGAHVTVLDRSLSCLRRLDDLFAGRVMTRYATHDALCDAICDADVVVGAVLVVGAAAPKLVTQAMLPLIKKGSVLVDVAIDQGGCFETSVPTTHAEPTYKVDGVVHYCVANMPGAVPRTASYALNHATLPFGLKLANQGLAALKEDAYLCAGLNVHRGRVTHPVVAEALGQACVDPIQALTQKTVHATEHALLTAVAD